jgi:hypothetical protein
LFHHHALHYHVQSEGLCQWGDMEVRSSLLADVEGRNSPLADVEVRNSPLADVEVRNALQIRAQIYPPRKSG